MCRTTQCECLCEFLLVYCCSSHSEYTTVQWGPNSNRQSQTQMENQMAVSPLSQYSGGPKTKRRSMQEQNPKFQAKGKARCTRATNVHKCFVSLLPLEQALSNIHRRRGPTGRRDAADGRVMSATDKFWCPSSEHCCALPWSRQYRPLVKAVQMTCSRVDCFRTAVQ